MPENDNPSGPNRPSGDQLTPGPAGTGENELRWPTFEFAAGLAVAVGFLVRLSIAARSFLNGDEALHFMAANQPSWKLTYQASLTISHPPLLIFLMHIWRDLGSSELVLRLPSVIAGTAFCWILYKWVAIVFGRQTGVIAAIFVSFLPPLISLSAEIRQYAFLLFLAASTMYLLERAFAENSWKKMSAASVCLWLAILSHYSAVLLAFVLAIYAPLRMLQARQKRGLMVAWVTGQIGAVLLCFWLYLAYISVFGGRALHSWMDIYLHNSYFDPRRGHVLVFAVARTVSVFQYLLGQTTVGTAVFLLFVAAVVFVLRAPGGVAPGVSKIQLALLLLAPFAVNCAAAVFDWYPYGGTRHCVFLAIFAIAGISFGLYKVGARRVWLGVGIAVALVVACNLFSSHRFPYMSPSDQKRTNMDAALGFIHDHVDPSDLLFADNQTGILLGHYLCRQEPFFIDVWKTGLKQLNCGQYRLAVTDGRVFVFKAANFFASWDEAVHACGLRRGDLVWVLQAGWRWEDSLARQLQVQYSQFGKLKSYSFGNNITIFQLRVGEPLPSIAAHLSYIESIPPGSVVAGADNHAAVVDLSQ
jgi:Dolichyl-phosphate-mannose-protein mannosyltransferase